MQNKYKRISILTIIILILFFLGNIFLSNESILRSKLKTFFPDELKVFLKKTIFIFPEHRSKLRELEMYKNEVKKLNEVIYFKNLNIKKLDFKINDYFNDLIKEDYYKKKEIFFNKVINDKEFKNKEMSLKLETFTSSYLFNGKHPGARSTGYLDYYEDNIFISTGDGQFFYFSSDDLETNSIKTIRINSNIQDIIKTDIFNKSGDQIWSADLAFSVKDLKIINDNILVSFHHEPKQGCFNTSILSAKINTNNLIFENFFSPKECIKKDNEYGEFNQFHSGGRIVDYKNNSTLFSMGEYRFRDHAQNPNSIFGKIISINNFTKEYKIISMGHRNPQGLYYNKENDYILSTEHGPMGGDEINLNLNLDTNIIENFGWPISSYGNHYDKKFVRTSAPLHKSHSEYGFIEPIKYYTPSIGISEIVKIQNSFGKYYNNDFFVLAMGSRLVEDDLSIHHLKFNNDFSEIIEENIIKLGERVRDIVYLRDLNKFVAFLETTGSLLIISNKLH